MRSHPLTSLPVVSTAQRVSIYQISVNRSFCEKSLSPRLTGAGTGHGDLAQQLGRGVDDNVILHEINARLQAYHEADQVALPRRGHVP